MISTERSRIMRSVKSKDTGPEMVVRRLVHGLGYRYRLHRSDLPGTPDLVLPGRNAVIFVHGCFWHGHDCPRGARVPKTNRAYWMAKIVRNSVRDAANLKRLKAAGWRVLTLWECDLKSAKLQYRITHFLG